MAEEKGNPYGYDQVDDVPTGGGRYLAFKKGDKGRIIQIRLASEPKYILQHWIMGSDGKSTPVECTGDACPYCGESIPAGDKIKKTALWGWVVIDRTDGGVKFFTGPTLIARGVREETKLIKDIKKPTEITWLNPLEYDFQITRTEEPGSGYYKVKMLSETKGELTDEEKKALNEANIVIEDELKGGKKSEHVGNYGTDDLETADGEENIDVPDDLGEDDDIPF